MIGQTIAHYEVRGKLGEGGMGEVYRAFDSKLSREVALKLLPEQLATDVDLLARFEREAQLLASLSHPGIGQIYGLEEHGETKALVLELIEGPALDELLREGPLELDQALDYALQIATALEAAHERGIIHRDLKPSNVKVTPEGVVKLLDFGLAKALETESAVETQLSQSPTLTGRATLAGVILGTAAYMSPEQARGLPADRRSDVWSFGVVLYEMLGGRQAFGGDTISDILATVLKSEPDWQSLPPLPAAIRRLLRRCLKKDVAQRLQWIGDARLEIEEHLRDPEPEVPAPPAAKRSPLWMIAGVAGVIVLATLLRPLLIPGVDTPDSTRLVRFQIPLNETLRDGEELPTNVAISPDGSRVAYVSQGRIWLRRLDQVRPRQLTSDGQATWLFWAPDSRRLGFLDLASHELKWIDVESARSSTVTRVEAPYFLGATWGPDERIVFAAAADRFADAPSGLYEISARGAFPSPLYTADRAAGELSFAYPHFLPDGRLLAVRRFFSSPEDPLSALREQVVAMTSDGVRYLADEDDWVTSVGHIVYSGQTEELLIDGGGKRESGIAAVPLSLTGMRIDAEGLRSVAEDGVVPSLSRDGTLAYITERSPSDQMVWVDRRGTVVANIGRPHRFLKNPSIAPNGSRVAVTSLESGNEDIWIFESATGSQERVTTQESFQFQPAWAPDGETIVFAQNDYVSTGGYVGSILRKRVDADRTELAVETPEGIIGQYEPHLSSDGRYLVYISNDGSETAARWDLRYLEIEEGARPTVFLDNEFGNLFPVLSPDSRFIAYYSNESGRYEVYTRRFPSGEDKRLISTDGGFHPRWSADGTELFYHDGGSLLAVAVDTTGERLEHGVPEALFDATEIGAVLLGTFRDLPAAWTEAVRPRMYDVSPDGQRFVLIRPVTESGSKVEVVKNWAVAR